MVGISHRVFFRSRTARIFLRGVAALAVLAATVVSILVFKPHVIPTHKYVEESRRLPVIMYHSLLRDPARAGDYVISPDVVEGDIIWLLEHGYTPVLISDAVAFVSGEGVLPQRPVALTLDDGFLNNALYLPDILQKHGVCATVAVVGEFTETYTAMADPNPNYGYMTWGDVRALAETGLVEIANHSYFAHTRVPKTEEGRKKYAATLAEDAAAMQRALLENAGIAASVYAYPYGYKIKGADELLAELGIKATLSCNEGVNMLVPGQSDCLFSMKRFNRPAGITTERFMEKIMK